MDPNATLRMIEDADTLNEAREYAGYLSVWLARGGFEPDWEAYPKGTELYRRLTSPSDTRK